tara:strand:- start:4185 stop:4913 length:729 start_codon:yes stop_codon:yes gene_type:complete
MKKISLLIPINGYGSRFIKYSTFPKPLIKIAGKEMIFWLLDNLDLKKVEKIIIPYSSILDQYNFKQLITERYKEVEFKLVSLPKPTSGAVETIQIAMKTLKDKELKSNFMLMDCDTFYYDDVIDIFKNSTSENAIFYFADPDGLPIFSYIKIKDNLVKEIKEKEKISNFANCGIFCVKDGYTLKKYCSMLLLSKLKQYNEFYTSGIFDLMIKDNIEVAAIEIEDFKCVGTPTQLENFLRERI